MSFRGEMLGFARGMKAGTDFWGDTARRQYQEAGTEAIRNPRAEELDKRDDPLEGGGGKIPLSQGGTDPGKTSSTGKVDNDTNQVAGRLKGDLMRDFKLSDAAAGGIVASLAAETGGFKTLQETNPTVAGSRGGYGYAQWTGPRRVAFEKYAKDNNLDINSYEANYGNLKRELQGPEGAILKDLANAKDYREATQIFTGSAKERRGFLRPGNVNMAGRFNWADKLAGVQPIGGEGTAVASSGKGVTTTPEPPATDSGDEQQASADTASYSPEAGIPVPETIKRANIDPFAYAQLLDQEIPAGPQTQPTGKDEALPALFAQEGGAIPEPQYMAAGGLPNAIDYTQAPPPTTPAAPVTVKPLAPAGPTPSQLAFRKLNAVKPVAPVAPPKPVTPAAPTQSWIQLAPGGYGGGDRGTGGASSSTVWRVDPISGKRRAMPRGAHFVNQKLMTQYPNLVMPGLMRYQEGGMIPEPDEPPVQQFARGGAVDDDDGYWTTGNPRGTSSDERFQQLLKEEQRRPQNQGGGDNARDRAARRLSAEEGRPSSTAYRPGRKQLAPGKGGKIEPKGGKKADKEITTKSVGKPEIADPHTNVVRTPTPEIADPHTNVVSGVKPELADPHTNVVPTVPAAPAKPTPYDPNKGPLPTSEIIKKVLPGPPDVIPDEPVSVGGALDPGSTGVLPDDPYAPPAPPAEASPAAVAADVAANKAKAAAAQQRLIEQRNAANQPALAPGALAAVPPDLVQQPPPPPEVPVLPEPIDLRAAPTPAPAAAAPPTGVDHARLLQGAMKALAAGQDPQAIGQLLLNAGITQELWPLELQNSFLGFAEGGMIPEPGQRGYNEAVAEGRTATREAEPQQQRRATPKLLGHVSQAVDGGIRFLTREFGLDREGAVPSPADDSNATAGGQRLASGEGAATPDEIQQVDDAVDPQRQMNEGDRHMTRLAKTVQWYLERGRKDDAEAAAASLMQYGAQRFGRLGMAAEGAYREYLESGDPKDLKNTTDFLENAYKMIPDGADINISIDPETHRLQGTRTTADGKTENYDLSADEIPGLLKSTQDGSMYWNQIYRLGDPEGTKLREQHAYKQAETADTRRYEEQQDIRKRELDLGEKTAEEERAAGREETRSKRDKKEAERVRLENEVFLRSRPDKSKKGDIDTTAVAPALAEASTAKAALDADPDNEQLQSAYNVAASRLYDATGLDAQWMTNGGFGPDTFEYQGNSGTAGAASEPPVPGAQRMLDENNQEIWAVEDPDSPSGWSKVE